MKNILVYITILIMMMPGVKLSADITLRTNDPFATKAPTENNPFAGGTPKDIERNLFTPKQIQVRNLYRVTNINQNKNRRVSYLNDSDVARSNGATSLGGGGNTTLTRKYNVPYSGNVSVAAVGYSMPTTIKVNMTEAFTGDEGTTTTPPSMDNYYNGAGSPSQYAPVGDAILPLLLLAMMYVVVMRRKRESMS
jgi:hypothetical protein